MLVELKKNARELLESGSVAVIIGYGEGSAGNVRPVFILKPENTDQLVFDDRCTQNLAVYLNKPEVRKLGKPAIIARPPSVRTINQLIAENQIRDNDIMVIGIAPDNTVQVMRDAKSVGFFISKFPFEITQEERLLVESIEKMPPEERWEFWKKELAPCIKCYACRQGCPLCYCSRCTVECNQPQWISVPSHDLGNLEWHVMRAMHLAGRCGNCGECFRACPIGIRMNLLTQRLALDIMSNFTITVGKDGAPEYPLSTFKPDDKEDFFR